MFTKSLMTFTFFLLVRSSESLNCYQKVYTPLANDSRPPLQALLQSPSVSPPSIVCAPTATGCFTFTCSGATSYTYRGCLDPPRVACHTMESQCPYPTGTECYACSRDNCNGPSSPQQSAPSPAFSSLSPNGILPLLLGAPKAVAGLASGLSMMSQPGPYIAGAPSWWGQ